MKQFWVTFAGALAAICVSGAIILGIIFLVIGSLTLSSTSVAEIKEGTVLCVTLEGEINERYTPVQFSQYIIPGGQDKNQGLDNIVNAIDHAAGNENIKGIFLDCKGAQAGVATLQSLREALTRFKERAPGKWIYAYGDQYSQGDYYVASAADSVFLNPIGQIDLHGLASQTMYFKNLLDKLGVEMQVVKVGSYKSAVEPFMLDAMSAASREQQELYLNNIWNNLARSIAESRHLKPDTVKALSDEFIFTASPQDYVGMHLVDNLVYRHQMDEKLKSLTRKDKVNMVNPTDYCSAVDVNKKGDGKGAQIAVVYAEGEITENGKEGIASEKFVPLILDLAKKEDIKGLILRVNSPGGSAFASEQIWEAVKQYKTLTHNPVYVSMGDYAASGGYYISCGADKIFAEPSTLTGSIGIYGMIPNAQNLLNDKIGINTGTVSTGDAGIFPNIFEPMTPVQKAAMQTYVERGYELFTSRVAQGRKMQQTAVKMIAEGRVWDGQEALKLGLVDYIGDLPATVQAMSQQLKMDNYTLVNLPQESYSFWEQLLWMGNDAKARILNEELGSALPLYKAIEKVKNTSTLQCRMDYFTLQL